MSEDVVLFFSINEKEKDIVDLVCNSIVDLSINDNFISCIWKEIKLEKSKDEGEIVSHIEPKEKVCVFQSNDIDKCIKNLEETNTFAVCIPQFTRDKDNNFINFENLNEQQKSEIRQHFKGDMIKCYFLNFDNNDDPDKIKANENDLEILKKRLLNKNIEINNNDNDEDNIITKDIGDNKTTNSCVATSKPPSKKSRCFLL
eukprot:TRINITY_DN4004_c1_g8_i1.p1 TRINITY_DN4004_c1_g8~~TRINITY_DN4004_c1_g8_i1.p1  ORF type:complete len:201 (+),score=41.60 TRINITY_DN4004_c1_g8_i1:63-665(+)